MTLFDKLDLLGAIVFVIYCSISMFTTGTLTQFQIWILLGVVLWENGQKHWFKRQLNKKQ